MTVGCERPRKYARRSLTQATARSARLVAWVGATTFLDACVLPMLGIGVTATTLALLASGAGPVTLLGLLAGLILLDANVAAFALSTQEDDLSLVAFLPFLYPYLLFLNVSWAFAVLDEVRGAKMRW